jgi:hypothetical protein
MQSKYKITRQIPLTTTYYDATQVINHPDKYAFSFNPQSGQGIYANASSTKGFMASGYADFQNGGNLSSSITQQCNALGGNCILRDMGKTIFASYLSSDIGIPSTKAYFRQVQLISPTSIGSNGWNGGPNGSTFGVTGYPSQRYQVVFPYNSASYLTFYIPVTIANIVAQESTNTGAYAIAGGQL